jgi:hypothetical protein
MASLRKYILQRPAEAELQHDEIPVVSIATVLVTSETAEYPIENIFDSHRGPGGTRWIAEAAGEQTLILAFDTPQSIRKVRLEVEEPAIPRTQELQLSLSQDGGQTYREVLRQEYNFSPPGTSFQREEWTVPAQNVTHLRLWIKPDKGGKPCRATLTSFAIQ